jgi:enoyl-CoA hydratase/carnithine racemase
MSKDHVLVDTQDRVLRIRLNRPDKKNALTAAMYAAIADTFQRADADPNVRALLIAGTQDCFTSGNDIMDFLNNPPTGGDSPVTRFLLGIAALQKPLVAAVNGPAIGVGVTLLLHCDLVYAGRSARLQMPFVNIGVCPEAASSLILPTMMGHQRAAELILLGDAFSAEQAREYGIVNAVLDDATVQAHALDQARRLTQQPRHALQTAKALLKRVRTQPVQEAMAVEGEKFTSMVRGAEAVEAMTAFVQKRKPDFSRFN